MHNNIFHRDLTCKSLSTEAEKNTALKHCRTSLSAESTFMVLASYLTFFTIRPFQPDGLGQCHIYLQNSRNIIGLHNYYEPQYTAPSPSSGSRMTVVNVTCFLMCKAEMTADHTCAHMLAFLCCLFEQIS